jgi:hypothetical protein
LVIFQIKLQALAPPGSKLIINQNGEHFTPILDQGLHKP